MGQVYSKLFKGGKLSPSHKKIVSLIASDSKVLELGASSGYITKLLSNKGCLVDIVEKDKEDAKAALSFCQKGYIGSLDDEKFLKTIRNQYDVILAADVLEHLQSPEIALNFIKSRLRKNGKVVISLPNIASWQGRRDLFFKGKFDYEISGLMDRTHLRFYTLNSFKKLLLSSGFRVKQIYLVESSYPFKFKVLSIKRVGGLVDKLISKILLSLRPNLFSYHNIFEAYVKK